MIDLKYLAVVFSFALSFLTRAQISTVLELR